MRQRSHCIFEIKLLNAKIDQRAAKSEMFRYLTDLGNHCKLFYKEIKTRGRPPTGYEKLDLTDPEQLALAILKIVPKDF